MTDTYEKLYALLKGRTIGKNRGLPNIRRIECRDGFSVSMQADEYKYCSPRDSYGPWHNVELGFPSAKPTAAVMQYVENPDDPTNTVYGYVPLHLVAELVDSHGGLKEDR